MYEQDDPTEKQMKELSQQMQDSLNTLSSINQDLDQLIVMLGHIFPDIEPQLYQLQQKCSRKDDKFSLKRVANKQIKKK